MVAGLGYDTDYFRCGDQEVIHVAVPYVDLRVRALAPVWLPHVAPAPLCGLGGEAASRRPAHRSSGPLCQACSAHLRDLDEWVRQAEAALSNGGTPDHAEPMIGNRVHAMPF